MPDAIKQMATDAPRPKRVLLYNVQAAARKRQHCRRDCDTYRVRHTAHVGVLPFENIYQWYIKD